MATNLADVSLLATKLFVPRPRPGRVSRLRLRDQLDAARGGIVMLAAAPAGSGKSTLLAEWALSTQRAVAWLSPSDSPPSINEPRRGTPRRRCRNRRSCTPWPVALTNAP